MQQQRFSPTSPPHTDPPMTYDEASMQGSRHFFMALQELKNLRPQLYSAAEYCESSYLFNDQKQVVLENLKDYTVKALVNAVDHLGTVAYKLDEVLSQQISEISSAEIRVVGLSQKMRVCQEHRNVEGFSQQRPAKVNRRYHKHYLLPAEAMPNYKGQSLGKRQDEMQEPEIVQSSQNDSGRTLLWHLAADPFTPRKGARPLPQGASRLASVGNAYESPVAEHAGSKPPVEHVGPSSSRTGHLSPVSRPENRIHSQGSSVDFSKPLSSHSSFDEKSNPPRGPVTSRSKSLLSSILGRRRSGKLRD